MAKALSTLANGSKVKDTGTNYFGQPIVFRVIDKNHTGYPANSVTLITDRILALKAFDGKEAGNADSNRASLGNNRYRTSNLRQWLNSTGAAGAWFTAQNLTDGTANTNNKDAAPTTANSASYNGYDTEAGFLAGFSANLRSALLSTTLTVAKNTVTDGGGSETVTDKVFLASETEVGLGNENNIAEGAAFAYFADANSRLALPTPQAVSNSNYTNTSFNATAAWYYWLRSPYASNSYIARYVDSSGTLNLNYAYNGYFGVRPLLNLSSSILVSDTTDSDGAYTIVWNSPPTIPPSITVPATLRGGTTAEISWGVSTDTDGNMSGYTLERSVNGAAYTQLYKGINRTYTDTITFGWSTVTYRVKAYDAANAESGYQTAPTRTVVNNTPPTISGSDGDLGVKTGAFSQSYTVTDTDAGDTLTVVEKVDGVQKRSFTATSGNGYSLNISADDFLRLLNGAHTLTITATDSSGTAVTRTYTFSKNVTEIEFTLTTPLAADDVIEKLIQSVTRTIPPTATFTVLVCNNGFDATPTWEDATNAVISNNKFFFTNTTKTAAQWGFNFKINVARNGAAGDCYITSVGGNFE